MLEHLGINYNSWDAGVLATDISDTVLKFAKEGIYPADRVSRVPIGLRQKYFTAHGSSKMEAVSGRVKQEITLRRFNLMNKEFPFKLDYGVFKYSYLRKGYYILLLFGIFVFGIFEKSEFIYFAF